MKNNGVETTPLSSVPKHRRAPVRQWPPSAIPHQGRRAADRGQVKGYTEHDTAKGRRTKHNTGDPWERVQRPTRPLR